MTWSDTKELPSGLLRFNLRIACLMILDKNERFAMSLEEISNSKVLKGQQRLPHQHTIGQRYCLLLSARDTINYRHCEWITGPSKGMNLGPKSSVLGKASASLICLICSCLLLTQQTAYLYLLWVCFFN